QVHFAVAAYRSAGSDRHCRVVIRSLILLDEAHYGRSSGLAAGAGESLQRWAVEWFRKSHGLLQRVETIAGNGALGKDHQFRGPPGGSANPVGYRVSVCFRIAELAIHLNACDAGLWHRSPKMSDVRCKMSVVSCRWSVVRSQITWSLITFF